MSTILTNFLWRFLERIGAQGVSLIVSIILARLLAPSIYGIIALVTVFITILNVFIDSGLAMALVQKKNADDLDFSSVFWFNILACSLLYIILFLSAPSIASFYRMPDLTLVIRILGLQLIVSGIKNIQLAYVSRTLQFKRFFFATLGGTIGAAIIGIYLAYRDFGVWALVAQQLFNTSIDTLILWLTVDWRPHAVFSCHRLLSLLSYGWKLLVSALLDTGYNNLRSLIIGKLYAPSDLAFYNRGQQFPGLIVSNINTSIDSVLLPTMAREQEDKERVRSMTRRAIKTSTYLMMPLMVLLAVCAEDVVRLVLTDKWLESVFYLRIFCFTYAFYPIHTANLNAINALGRSDLFLKLEIVKKVMGLTALGATMFISVRAMAYSLLVTSVLGQVINSWPNRRLLKYGYKDQVRDMHPQIGISCLMGGAVYLLQAIMNAIGSNIESRSVVGSIAGGMVSISTSNSSLIIVIKLLVQVVAGLGLYVGLSKLFKIDSYEYVVGLVRKSKLTSRTR